MGRVSGTIRKVTLDGLTYDVAADVDVTINPSIEKTGLPTSGRTMMQHVIRIPEAEAITLSADPTEQATLTALNKRLDSYPMALTLADGSVYRAVGQIALEGITTANNVATLRAIPNNASQDWELFAAA